MFFLFDHGSHCVLFRSLWPTGPDFETENKFKNINFSWNFFNPKYSFLQMAHPFFQLYQSINFIDYMSHIRYLFIQELNSFSNYTQCTLFSIIISCTSFVNDYITYFICEWLHDELHLWMITSHTSFVNDYITLFFIC